MRLTVIGAGPGGYESALEALKRGFDVTLVSDGPVGGTCLNEGCIPTKCLCRNAEFLEDLSMAGEFGVEASWKVDFSRVMARKEQVIGELRSGVEFLLRKLDLVYGKAEIKDGGTVVVGDREIESDFILIATGSVSASLPIPGAELCVSSKEMLSLEEVPRRLCVIGAGVIGLEFASIYRAFGSEVTVLEYCRDILPRFDTDLSKRLKQTLLKKGISIVTSAKVEAVEKQGSALSVRYVSKEKPFVVEADTVLMAVGRRPALESLDFASAGIETTPRGVIVNRYMETSLPGVYAVGDITGGIMLAHAAVFQGKRALNHIAAGCPSSGDVDGIDLGLVPAVVFTSPEAAMVGKTEEDCVSEGLKFRVLKSFFRANGKAKSAGAPEGYCKIIVSEEEGKILGCHLFGAHASDLIEEIAVAMAAGMTARELSEVIHPHPTLSEVIQSALDA